MAMEIMDWKKPPWEKFDLAIARKADETKHTYRTIIRNFVRFSGDHKNYDEGDVQKFLKYLEKRASENTQLVSYRVLKKLFRANNWDWPSDLIDLPRIDPEKIQQPILSKEETIQIIKTCKALKNFRPTPYMALSTVYGLRRGELKLIRREDVDFKAKRIEVRVLKQKRQVVRRRHLLPDEIIPILKGYSFPRISLEEVNALFKYAIQKAGIEDRPRLNFHSIRRALDTYLLDIGVPEPRVENFLRWSQAGWGRSMTRRYYIPSFEEIDREIFEKHPFLPYWR